MQPMANCQKSYDSFSAAAGCSVDDIQCLQALSVDDVHTAFKAIPVIDTEAFIFGPTVDGVEATQHSWVAAANGDVNKVPVMFGTNRDEGSMFCDLSYDATLEDLQTYWTAYGLDSAAIQTLTGVYLDGKTYVNMRVVFMGLSSVISIVVMFLYYWCIRKPWSSSIMFYNIISISISKHYHTHNNQPLYLSTPLHLYISTSLMYQWYNTGTLM